MSQPAYELKRACDKLPADIVLRLNLNGEAVSVEDRYGNSLPEVDVNKEPIQGTVLALESPIFITTKVNPTCFWIILGGHYYRICV